MSYELMTSTSTGFHTYYALHTHLYTQIQCLLFHWFPHLLCIFIVCVYVCLCVCIIHAYIQIYIHAYMLAYQSTYMHVSSSSYDMRTCLHTKAHVSFSSLDTCILLLI
jgi:hypothetical protein